MQSRTYDVLMVDDDEDDIFVMRRSMLASKSEFNFFSVSTPESLFAFLKDSEPTLPDVLLLDINMPRMNGFEILSQLKSIEHWSDIPVMVLSTSAHAADRAEAKRLGAVSFSTKFSSMKELKKWVTGLEKFLEARA